MNSASQKLLLDVQAAGAGILQHLAGKTLTDYSGSRLLRRAVEREFEIIGEALKRLSESDPAAAARVSELRTIISFRNRVIHGYDTVDDMVVWGITESRLPLLLSEVATLLAENGGAPPRD